MSRVVSQACWAAAQVEMVAAVVVAKAGPQVMPLLLLLLSLLRLLRWVQVLQVLQHGRRWPSAKTQMWRPEAERLSSQGRTLRQAQQTALLLQLKSPRRRCQSPVFPPKTLAYLRSRTESASQSSAELALLPRLPSAPWLWVLRLQWRALEPPPKMVVQSRTCLLSSGLLLRCSTSLWRVSLRAAPVLKRLPLLQPVLSSHRRQHQLQQRH